VWALGRKMRCGIIFRCNSGRRKAFAGRRKTKSYGAQSAPKLFVCMYLGGAGKILTFFQLIGDTADRHACLYIHIPFAMKSGPNQVGYNHSACQVWAN
jgi:hypothetical protein